MIIIAMDRAPVRTPHIEGYALDRIPGNRRYDADGHLHVSHNTLTKANVCPYFGWEIPGYRALGLDADRVYHMLRHPDEIAKAVETFNNKPVLVVHQPVTADDFPDELIGGTTGSEAAFDGTYLTNSIALWTRDAIDGVETETRRQLSSGYRYRPDMTPGIFEGLQYDGVMRDIACNHIALVLEGRAGPDVYVGDESMIKSRRALMLSGALGAHIAPLLTADAKFDVSKTLEGVTAVTLAADGAPAALAKAISDAAKPHLAADKSIDTDALTVSIQAVANMALDGDDEIKDPVPAQAPAPSPAPSPAPQPEQKDAPAMDEAAVKVLVEKARSDARAEAAAIDTAKEEIFPHVGKIIGLDSAAAYYKVALDAAKVDLTGVPESAYGAMVRMLPTEKATPRVAQDARQPGPGKLSSIIPNLQPMKVA